MIPRRALSATVAILASIVLSTSTYAVSPTRHRSIEPIAAANAAIAAHIWIAGIVARDTRAAFRDWVVAVTPKPKPVTRVSPPTLPALTPRYAVPASSSARPRAETPISNARCADRGRPDIGALIESVFGPAGPWAESVAVRESGCSPTAYNPSGAEGIFQLLGHADILVAVCGSNAWQDASCNVRGAYSLYLGSGTSPWSL